MVILSHIAPITWHYTGFQQLHGLIRHGQPVEPIRQPMMIIGNLSSSGNQL